MNILMYSDKLASFEYGENHPFKPSRSKQMMDLLNRYSLIYENNQQIIEPTPIKEEILYTFHEKDYIDLLKQCDKGEYNLEMLGAGLGSEDNPIVKGIYDFSLASSGATHQGAMMLVNDEADFVFNPLGGFHHGGRNHAEGFCYINDLAVSITDLVKLGKKVAYIDIDVHHGNGVQDAFYDTDKVLTISIHESGKTLYPWSGFEDGIGIKNGRGYNINIPLLKGTDDEIYIFIFDKVVPPLIKNYNPDIIVTTIGADTHREDPMAHLNLTTNGYEHVIRTIKSFDKKLLATGGGGYNIFKTSAMWALAWADFCGIEPEDSYAGSVGGMMYGPETKSGSLRDAPYPSVGDEKTRCMDHAEQIARFIKEMLFPLHGIKR